MREYEWVAYQKEPCKGQVHKSKCSQSNSIGTFGECSEEQREEIRAFQSLAENDKTAKMAASHALCFNSEDAYIAGEPGT